MSSLFTALAAVNDDLHVLHDAAKRDDQRALIEAVGRLADIIHTLTCRTASAAEMAAERQRLHLPNISGVNYL